ncbi:DUF1641 domain-containing protein [Paenibacillus sediminis]|uniref:Uncharacterized protein YjgD (DUF1641 family) n=1 Tax=Paenibacillus sediminis TaxID=664909 RepID=A0ABS4H4U5_9BACL|nr:DUF1641 domain-containing protein [Paenibacillus sediminis]MBP1937558.1 uncharacterized protein YjgD (DUF1641 family) [Paenibacillus sediminis]
MAKSINTIERRIPTEEELQAESLEQILKAVSDNRKAIVQFLDILKELQEAGALDIVQGILKNRNSLGFVGFEFMKVANIPTMLKNMIIVSQFLGRLDPAATQKLINGLDNGLEQSMKTEGKATRSVWSLLSSVRDPYVTSAMSTMLHFLRGMGEEFNKKEQGQHT